MSLLARKRGGLADDAQLGFLGSPLIFHTFANVLLLFDVSATLYDNS